MRRSVRAVVAACLAVPVLLMSNVHAAQAEEPDTQEPATTLTSRLAEVVEDGAITPTEVAEQLSLPVEGGGSLSFDDAGRVTVTVRFAEGPSSADLAALGEFGVVREVLTLLPAATVQVDPLSIETIEQLPGVLGVTLAMRAFTGAELRGDVASSARAPRLLPGLDPAGGSCSSLPVEADAALRSDLARATFGVDGTGVTVGIISDSFDKTVSPTSWADDVVAGALPGPGNPCGYLTPVEIISQESAEDLDGEDEGRAMAQLVHGIAPGAKLLFADVGHGELGMAQNIVKLAQAGADIIVDDISYPSEAYFQRGILSAAIEYAKANYGVAYFTSAGNSNAVMEGPGGEQVPITSWQTDAYRPMDCPDWLVVDEDDSLWGTSGYDCLDFDPGIGEAAYDTLTLKHGEDPWTLRALASIGEPLGGVTTAYQLRFYAEDPDDPGADPELLAAIASFGGTQPGLSGGFEADPESVLRLVMVRTAYDDSPGAFVPPVWLGFIRGADAIAERAFLGDGGTDRVGPMVFGHGGDGSGLSVAALHWDDPSRIRDYSSLGPGTLWYEDFQLPDLAPRPLLPEPVSVVAPHLAAVDGTATTFFGEEDSAGVYRFYGTSAAAPNAAAVAALGLAYAPGLTGAELSDLIVSTARGSDDEGPVNPYAGVEDAAAFGAGIVDAMGALSAVPVTAVQTPQQGAVSPTTLTVEWAAPATAPLPTSYRLELFTGELPAPGTGSSGGAPGVVAALPAMLSLLTGSLPPLRPAADPVLVQTVTLPASATSHTFTGLTPSTDYSVRITSVGAAGDGLSASVSALRTAAAGGGSGGGGTGGSGTEAGSGSPLPQLGGADIAPWLIGGAVLLLAAAAALIVAGAARGRRRDSAGEAPSDGPRDTGAS